MSPQQTSCKFSCFTSSKLQSACKISNSWVTKGEPNPLAHFLYSLTSQIAHIAPAVLNWNCWRWSNTTRCKRTPNSWRMVVKLSPSIVRFICEINGLMYCTTDKQAWKELSLVYFVKRLLKLNLQKTPQYQYPFRA